MSRTAFRLATAALASLLAIAASGAWAATGIVRVGAEIGVAPPVTGAGPPSVCTTPGGGFVVAHRRSDSGSARIVARRMSAGGAPLAPEIQVSTYAGGDRRDPDVACTSDGGFAVVWTDLLPPEEDPDDVFREEILARAFDSSNQPASAPFTVNAFTTGNQQTPAVCAQADDSFAIVWLDRKRDELDARVVQAGGPAADGELVAHGPRAFMAPDVACAGGKFLAVWGDFPSTAVNDEVLARAFTADGKPAGASFVVNADPSGDQGYPSVCGAPRDGFVVSWRDTSARRGSGTIRARHVTLGGAPTGAGFEVSPEGRNRADLACGSAGGFVVVTRADMEGVETLFAQAVDAERELVGPEIVVARLDGAHTLEAPPIAGDGDGRFVVAWANAAGADAASVRAHFFEVGDPAGTTTTTPTPPTTVPTTTSSTTTTTTPGNAECGDAAPNDPGLSVLDALVTLKTAVGTASCDPCTCDVDASGTVTVQDALRILSKSVGLSVALTCPAC